MTRSKLAAAALTRAQRNRALAALVLAMVILGLDLTIVNVALPAIGTAFAASDSDLQWVLDGFFVAMTGLILFGSGLADRIGRRRVLLIGLVLFAASSLVAGLSRTLVLLIVMRVIMGIGAAMVVPASFTMIAVVFPPEMRAVAIGAWTAAAGVSMAAGPVIAGVLLEVAGWGSVFLVNVPIALGAMLMAWAFVPESREVTGRHLDYVGAVTSVLGLAGIVFGLIEGPSFGWGNPVVVVAFVVGALGLAGLIAWELHTPAPMFQVRILGLPPVRSGAFAMCMCIFANFALLALIPQYLTFCLSLDPIDVGLGMLPMALSYALITPLNARVLRHLGARVTLTGGMIICALGSLALAGIGHLGYPPLAVGLVLVGVGNAFALPTSTVVIFNSLPVRLASSGAGLSQVSRQAGAALGIAVVGSIVSTIFRGSVGALPFSEQIVAKAERSIGRAVTITSSLPESLRSVFLTEARDAFYSAARVGFVVTAVLCALAAAQSWHSVRRGIEPRTTAVGAPSTSEIESPGSG